MNRWAACVLLLVAILPYWHATDYPHVHDDHDLRGPGSLAADTRAGWGALWRADVFGTYEQPTGHTGFWRPLITTSFRLEHRLFGDDSEAYVRVGHIVTLLIHGLAVLALWALLRALELSDAVAFSAAALFAVHPVHVEPVVWLSGRTEMLPAALAWLGTTWLIRREASPLRLGLAAVAFVAALLCKESALLLVGLAVPLARLRGRSWGTALGVAAAAVLMVLLMRLGLFEGGVSEQAWRGPDQAGTRWLTWLSIVPDLLRLLIWPGPAAVIRPVDPATAWTLQAVAGLGLTALGLATCAWGVRRRCIEVTFAALLVTGTLLMLAPWIRVPLGYREVAAPLYERHLYAAAAAPCMALAVLAPLGSRALVAVSLVLALALAPVTAGRTAVWSSDEAFARSALEAAPRSANFWNHLGVALWQAGETSPERLPEALDAFERATGYDPDDVLAGTNRFALRAMLGDEIGARTAAEELLRRHPEEPGVLDNVARWHMQAGRWSQAVDLLEAELRTGRPLRGALERLVRSRSGVAESGDG